MIKHFICLIAITLFSSQIIADEQVDQWVTQLEQCVKDNFSLDNISDTPKTMCIGERSQFCIEHITSPSDVDLRNCIISETKIWDLLLNKYYQKTSAQIAELKPDDQSYAGENPQESFKQAQRDWLKFRDSECEAHTLFNYGGSFSRIEYGSCLNEMTAERAIFFMGWNCEGVNEADCEPWIE